jgi:hypothetical protein
MIWWLLIAPVLIYVGLCVILFFLQDRLVYHPTRQIEQDPSAIGLEYTFVEFRSEDGVGLTGFYTPARETSRGTVLFCHGNGGNISHRLETIGIYHHMGFDTLVFDYRGYGRSEGAPSEIGTYRDARAAWDWLLAETDVAPGRVVIHGRSLGGPIAAHLARHVDAGGLIIESSFPSAPELGQSMYPIFPVRWLIRYSYDTAAFLQDVTEPVLVIHSREDRLVPWAQGRAVYDAAGQPKRFVEITGSHNAGFVDSGRIYTEGLESFLSEMAGL